MRMDDINALSDMDFVAKFGGLYEHSPWVAEGAASARPFGDAAAMLAAMSRVVRETGEVRQLELVRAHPELGNRAGVDPELTEDSASEQESVGLGRLTVAEYVRFRSLNDAYRHKFGMPFVICVRLAGKAAILDAMEQRLESTAAAELAEALAQIDAIASLRLHDRMNG